MHFLQKVDVSELLLVKDFLQFDSCKQQSPESEHCLFAFGWSLSYGVLKCS